MANHNAKVQPVRTKPIRTTWLKNALSSVGSTSKSVLKEYAPTFSGAVDSGADLVRSMRTSVVGTSRGTTGTNLAQNKYVKLANTAFKNALEDIKTGHLTGNDERAMSSMMSDNGFDDLFNENSSGGVTFGDEDGGAANVTMNYVNAGGSAEAFTSLSSSISKQTELSLKTAKAQTDAFVSLTSAQFFQNQQIGGQILSHLGAIEKNLASLVEYNTSNMNKFIESSIAYYDKMGQSMTGNGKNGEEKSPSDNPDYIGNVIGSDGRFDFGGYKKYVTSRLKQNLSNSEFGMITSIMDENTLKQLAANPLSMGASILTQWAMPEVIGTTIKGMDSALNNMMPNIMKKLGDWGNQQSSGIARKLIGTVAKSMGLDTERRNFIDKERDIHVNMDAVPFDGETKLAITNTITRELSQQTIYLKFIAEHMNGAGAGIKGQKRLESNQAALAEMQGYRTAGFDTRTNQYVTKNQLDDNILKSLTKSVTDAFNNTDFGKAITATINKQTDEDTKKQLERMQEQLYVFMNKVYGDDKVDLTSHNGRITLDLKGAVKNFGGSDDAKDTFIKILNDLATVDPVSFNSFQTGQIRSSIARDAKIKEMTKNPTRSGILQTDLFERKGKDGKVMSIDQLLEEQAKKLADAGQKKSKYDEVNVREAISSDVFANQTNMKFMDMLRNSSMQSLNNIGSAFLSGDSQGVVDSIGKMFSDAAMTVADAFNEKFFTPMHDKIFGVKDEDGFSRGGAISDMKNVLQDSFLEMQHRLTGKPYKDSSGQEHKKSEDSVFGTIKEGILEKFFGKKAVDENGNPTGKREKLGIFSKITDSIKQSFADWHNAIFGEDREQLNKDNVMKAMQDSLKDKLPNAMMGGFAGGAAGLASGGLLGAMIGGPIGGVILGSAVGFASKSEKFQKLIFGDQDKDNGIINKKTQQFIKDNKTALVGGAALGGLKGALLGGGGFLGTLVGGPVAGAILGMATTTTLKSKAFHDFLFGDEEHGRLGVIKSFKNVMAHNKERKDAAGLDLTGKTVGMGATGAAAGALSVSLLSQIGFMPAMLSAAGPVGGAIVGLGLAIKGQSDTFSRWLFGNKKPKDSPEYQAGVLGQLGNALQVYVLQPFKHTTEEIATDIGITFRHKILGSIENAIEPIGIAVSDAAYAVKKKATSLLNWVGRGIMDKIADPFVNLVKTTVLQPFQALGTNVAKLTYNVAKQTALLPFRALDAVVHVITSPVTNVVKKIFHPIKGAKWLMNTIANAFELATGKSLDPLRNLMDKWTKKAKNIFFGALKSPFKLVGGLVGGVAKGVGFAANAVDNIGETGALKKMEKGGLFDEADLRSKYKKEVQKNGQTQSFDEWKDNYIKSKDKNGYTYLEKLKKRYENEKERGNVKTVNGEVQGFDAWREDYMRQDFRGRLKAQNDQYEAEKGKAELQKIQNKKTEYNQKKILKYTGNSQWEDTVENRAMAEARAGKKIKWRGEAKNANTIDETAGMDAEQIAKGDQSKMTNSARQVSILQQILNVIQHKNPDGSKKEDKNTAKGLYNGQSKEDQERLKHGEKDTETSSKEEKAETDEEGNSKNHSRFSSAQFMTGTKMKKWSLGRRYLQANHMVPDEELETMSEREVQSTLKKYGVDATTLSEYGKKAGVGGKLENTIYSIFGKLSGKGYAEGTDDAKEGYSVVGEAGRPEIVWTNKGDKVYSDKRKPLRVEIVSYAKDAVGKFVKYIKDSAKKLTGGGSGTDATPGESNARIAADAYSQIDDGEAAENNEVPAGAQLALPMHGYTDNDGQTDTTLPSVLGNPELAVIKSKQETREKAMDAAKTAEEQQQEKEAEKQRSLGGKLLDGIKNIAANTKEQVKSSAGFFKDWLLMFGKKGLIGAGIIAGLTFLNKTGLLQKLVDFIGNVASVIPTALSKITEDVQWQVDNRANTNGQSAEDELNDTLDSVNELRKGNILGFLTNKNGEADHLTAAKAKFLRNTLKKPIKWGIKLGKGLKKGFSFGRKAFKYGVNGVKNGVRGVRNFARNMSSANRAEDLGAAYEKYISPGGSTIETAEGAVKNGGFDSGMVLDENYNKDFNIVNSYDDATLNMSPEYGDVIGADGEILAEGSDIMKSDAIPTDTFFGDNLDEVMTNIDGDAEILSGDVVDATGDVITHADDAIVNGAKNVGSEVAENTGLALYDPKFAAQQMAEDVAEKTVTGASDDAVMKGAEGAIGKSFTKNADDVVEVVSGDVIDAGGKVLTSQADDIAEGGAKLAMESAGETAEKSTSKMGKKIIKIVQEFFEKVGKKIGNSKWVTKVMEKLTKSKAFLSNSILGKMVKKVTAFLGKHVGAAAATLGTSELAGITIGALNGLTGAARLFQVNKEEVDGTMKLISFAMGAFTGSTPGGIVDIVNEITASMCGFDLLNVAACSAYKILAGDDKYEKLLDKQSSFKSEYLDSRNEDLKTQYETLQKAGLADKWESEDAYIEAVNNGEVNGKYKSFQDYNSDENASVMEKATKTVTNVAVKGFKGVKTFLFGDDGEEGYNGATGNRYVKNKDGTFTIYDKEGNLIGEVGDESNFQEDIVSSFGGENKKTGVVGKIRGMGKTLKNAAAKVGDGISAVVSDISKNAGKFASSAVKLTGKVWNFFTDHGMQQEGWELNDGTGMWYDNDGQLHNLNGDVVGDPITNEELSDLIRANAVHSIVWHDRTGFEKFLGNAGDTIIKAGQGLWKKGGEVKDAIVSGLGKLKENAGKILTGVGTVIVAAPIAATLFFKKHRAVRYMCNDGTYYQQKTMNTLKGAAGDQDSAGWYHFSASGDMLSDEPLTAEEMQSMVTTGAVTETSAMTSGLSEWVNDSVVPGFNKIKDKAVESFTNGLKVIGDSAQKAIDWAGTKLARAGRGLDRLGDNAHMFLFGGTQVRLVANDGSYYVPNDDGSGYAHYTINGSLMEDVVDSEIVDTLYDTGQLAREEYTEDNILEKAGATLSDIRDTVGQAFSDGLAVVEKGISNTISAIGTFNDSVEKYGLWTTITSPFKKSKTVGYYDPSGNYYVREGEKFTYYSQNGDVLEENIDAEEIDSKMKAGLLVKGDVIKDSKAQEAVKSIQESAKKAWEKAKNIVTSGWEKFTNWITGGSGSGVESKGTGGSFGIGTDDYGSLPEFTGGGSGFGSRKKEKSRRIFKRGGFGRKPVTPDRVNGHSYYAQTDTRWANDSYEYNNDGGTIGNSGCGPAAMSMVVSDMTGSAVDPTQMAMLAQATGTRDNTGTNWNFISGAASSFGLDSEQRYAPSSSFVHNSLKNGNEVVLSGISTGTGTPYTSAGHYVVAVGEDANGRIRVNDPRGKVYSRSYKPEDLMKYTGSAWSIGGHGSGVQYGNGGGFGRTTTPKALSGNDRMDGTKTVNYTQTTSTKTTNKPKINRASVARNASSGNDKLDALQQGSKYTPTTGTTSTDTSVSTINGFPYFYQGDSRWKDNMYSSSGNKKFTIGTSGSGPTSMAMVLQSFGTSVTPAMTAQYGVDNKYAIGGALGTQYAYFPSISSKYNVTATELDLDGNKIKESLTDSNPVIAAVKSGSFSPTQKYVVLVGLKDGGVLINDPTNKRTSMRSYNPSIFKTQGYKLWSFKKNASAATSGDSTTGDSTLSSTTADGSTTTNANTSTVLDKISTVFSELGNRAMTGALTGQWDTDFSNVFSNNTSSSSTSSSSSTVSTSATTLTGNADTEKIYNYLVGTAGMTPYGAAGLMGNLEAESGMNPKAVEQLLAGKIGTNDDQYTSDIDSGKISKAEFLNPLPGKVYGYGLAQWTTEGRKEGLYDLAKSRNTSIGDLGTQLDWLLEEMKSGYSTVYSALKTATSVQDASNIVLHKFEGAADQSTSVENARGSKGQAWYNKYAAASGSKGGFGIRFLRAINKLTGGRGVNKLLNRMRGGKGATAADAREAIVGWMLCIIGQNTYTQSGDRSRVMEGVDGHGFGDCSSTCCKIYETTVGKVIGSYTGDMIDAGTVVEGDNSQMGTYPDESKMLPGDLIFYYSHGSSGECGHVEMYIGNGNLAGHGSGTGPKIHEIKAYQDSRTGAGYGTWIRVVRYLNESDTYNVNAPDKSKYKVQNTFTDGKGKSSNGKNTGATSSVTGNTNSTSTGSSASTSSNNALDKVSTIFSELGNRAMNGALTGTFDTDFSSVFSNNSGSTSTSGTTNASSSSAINGEFSKYTFTDAQKKYIARTITRENGGDDYATNLDSASHMVNLNEVQKGNPATGDALYNMVKNSGWYGHYDDNDFPAYAMNPPQGVYDAISEVMEKGNRTLPRYVTEYDMFPLDAAISGHWGNGSSEDRSQYVKHKTLISQNPSRFNYGGAKYTFYKFLGDKGDVAGYYEQYYQKYKADDPRPDNVTPEPGGSGIGTRSHLADPKVLNKIAILRAQGDQSAISSTRGYKPPRTTENNRAIARAERRDERSKAYQQALDLQKQRKAGGRGAYVNNDSFSTSTGFSATTSITEIMSRADNAKSTGNDTELLRCMLEILAIIAENTGKSVNGLSQATELLANLKGSTNVVVSGGSDTGTTQVLRSEGTKPTRNAQLAKKIAAGK